MILRTRRWPTTVLVGVLFGCAHAADGETAGPATDRTGMVGVAGGRLYFETGGQGDPVVLLHGGGLDLRMWDGVWPDLARNHHVIRYDLRAHGRSTAAFPGDGVADLRALLDSLGIGTTSLVGLSMGSGVALEFAARYPARVQRLVLVSLSGPRDPADAPALLEKAATIRVPTLVLRGESDERAAAFQIADAIPGAQTAVITGAGHLPNLDQPARFVSAVERFLRGLHP